MKKHELPSLPYSKDALLPYLSAEKGPLGMAAIRDLCACFDPKGIMNPGKLVPGHPESP